jgi:hypothetical protein
VRQITVFPSEELEIFARKACEEIGELPLFQLKPPLSFPGTLTLLIIAPYRSDLPRFLQEILGRELQSLFYAKHKESLLFYGILSFETKTDLETFLSHFPVLEREMVLGIRSIYHAKRLLEGKSFTCEEKTLQVQERIPTLLRRYGKFFDFDLYDWMQKLLLEAKEAYKEERSPRTLLKIGALSYVFLGALSRAVEKAKNKRHLFFKLIRVPLETLFGSKETLGFFIALNFIKENEVFERKRFLKIIQRASPRMRLIKNSLFQHHEGSLYLLYVEMEKEGEEPISRKEIQFLKKVLQSHLQGCIESLVRPIFMPRNEEEVMKYVVTLGGQIQAETDLPQIVILFDEQSDKELFFTVVIVRPLLSETKPLDKLFPREVEKTRVIGYVEKKIPKEAGVLRLHLSNTPFLREDSAVDLYKARQKVVKHLTDILGPLRDYNGGMIARQMEALEEFKQLIGKSHSFMAESFFHAIYPAETRLIVKKSDLKNLYQTFLDVFEGKRIYREKIDRHALCVCMKFSDPRRGNACYKAIHKMRIPSGQLVRLSFPIQGAFYLGYLFFSESPAERELFLEKLKEELYASRETKISSL